MRILKGDRLSTHGFNIQVLKRVLQEHGYSEEESNNIVQRLERSSDAAWEVYREIGPEGKNLVQAVVLDEFHYHGIDCKEIIVEYGLRYTEKAGVVEPATPPW